MPLKRENRKEIKELKRRLTILQQKSNRKLHYRGRRVLRK
jgi:hypothetical protein